MIGQHPADPYRLLFPSRPVPSKPSNLSTIRGVASRLFAAAALTLGAWSATVAATAVVVPADCSGPTVNLQDQEFNAIDITCSATLSITAVTDVTLLNSAAVSLLAPTVSLNGGFQVEQGSVLAVRPVTYLPPPSEVSINSTSQSSGDLGLTPAALGPVAEQSFAGNSDYRILAINDLGMHCGDLDSRIVNILPPFNVLHAQVLARGGTPTRLGPTDVEVVYSATSHRPGDLPANNGTPDPGDPALATEPSLAPDASVFKTNFWNIALEAFAPFYPPGALALFYPNTIGTADLGLPVPDVEERYLGTGALALDQQPMPSATEFTTDPSASPPHQPLTLATDPYVANRATPFAQFVGTLPFFVGDFDNNGDLDFPFGYTSEVNWFAADGVPIAPFDDFGRENAYPLLRVQARASIGNLLGLAAGTVVASLDTVVPISSEAECQGCHAAPADGGNGAGTQALADVGIALALSIDDPKEGLVPIPVSVEYASDINILRLHDLKHGSGLGAGAKYQPDLVDQTPVTCQRCHYTPALDLLQVGPLGPETDDPVGSGGPSNGRDQYKNKSMSNVMHAHHATFTDLAEAPLFPIMPAPTQDTNGDIANQQQRLDVLDQTCYQCHPGNRTQCLRGAMFNGGMLCQDCHGDMAQIGNDFSRNVGPSTPGAFELAADYYTTPGVTGTPRVPWANEPSCGSCHTGDDVDNLANTADTITNVTDVNGNQDGIRLIRAYRTSDVKATPIVPTNKRFAENVVDAADNPDAAGNPKLYRLSTGHGGLFCEACHGSTHAIWPNANPFANDNVPANQLQGHRGTVIECGTCHITGSLSADTQSGPHELHLVNDGRWYDAGAHKEAAKIQNLLPDGGTCSACHGSDHLGTVLSRTPVTRTYQVGDATFTVPAGQPVPCNLCHTTNKSFRT